MTYRELTRKLTRLGCVYDRQAGGSRAASASSLLVRFFSDKAHETPLQK